MAHNSNYLIDAYRRLRKQADPVVLASIIETCGSTYQKAGARMLIARNGETTSLLGGGCFERDLLEQAQSVFESGQAKTVFYDMRSPDDVIWGLGLGCNGAVRVLLQLLHADQDFSPLNSIVQAASADTGGVLVTFYESEHGDYPSGNNLFLPDVVVGHSQASSAGDVLPFLAAARQCLMLRQAFCQTHQLDGRPVKAFYDFIRPPFRLLVLGAGADAVPLVQCAASLGWRVSVVDYRSGYLKPERFAQAEQLLQLMPQTLSEQLALDRFDAMVLMTHNIDYDRRYLQQIAASPIPFIGLLGPAPRRDKLLQSLDAAGPIRERVFGPVGLDIGAQTPEEIALSIMAGIYAAQHNLDGGQLDRGTDAVVSDQADDCSYR